MPLTWTPELRESFARTVGTLPPDKLAQALASKRRMAAQLDEQIAIYRGQLADLAIESEIIEGLIAGAPGLLCRSCGHPAARSAH